MMLKKLCMFLLCSSKYCSQVADGYEDDLLVPSSKDWWNNLLGKDWCCSTLFCPCHS